MIKDGDPLTEKIIACAYKMPSELGPGFNEGIYHNTLKTALEEGGLGFQTEKKLFVSFQGKHVGGLRLDLTRQLQKRAWATCSPRLRMAVY